MASTITSEIPTSSSSSSSISTTTTTSRKSCPCKKIPLYLSSWTAAEYGDLHTLLSKSEKESSATTRRHRKQYKWNEKDQYGITPLHLAAQNDHVAVVAMMLKNFVLFEEKKNDNTATVTTTTTTTTPTVVVVTPLHRASFSGAVTSMKLLLDHFSDQNQLSQIILAQDKSFGDLMTPLHKAAAGGRYLAVQLLLQTLSSLPSSSSSSPLYKLALNARDSQNRTPLDVAKEQLQKDYDGSERKSVARWDQVAGGIADWNKCVQLLSTATTTAATTAAVTTTGINIMESSSSSSSSSSSPSLVVLPPKPNFSNLFSTNGGSSSSSSSSPSWWCIDCNNNNGDDNNSCKTAVWQTQFRMALGNSIFTPLQSSSSLSPLSQSTTTTEATKETTATTTTIPLIVTETAMEKEQEKEEVEESVNNNNNNNNDDGVSCSICKKITIALYPISSSSIPLQSSLPTGKLLVCKSCKRNIHNHHHRQQQQ